MSNKRRREPSTHDTQLIGIYEDLANENEEIRLKAAHALLLNFSDPSLSSEYANAILKRLFRGLCSGRKAARLGFSVALTEYLSQLFQEESSHLDIDRAGVIDLLEMHTVPEGNTSGQDERDHYFGRLFGAEAIIRSSMLFVSSGGYQEWERLLDIVCTLANRKLWLRQECGWLLFNSICNLSVGFASLVLEHLNLHKLIRTPEGVAIWLEVSKRLPKAQLPKHVWKHGDPLNHHEIDSLAGILKDAKPKQSAHEDSKLDSQGKGMWSPFLHFVWDVVLRDLGEVTADANKANKGVLSRRVEFRDFWSQAVEQSLFAHSSSTERKHWGLLLVSKVFAEGSERAISQLFMHNTIACIVSNLGGDDRYLHRSAQKAVQAMHARAHRNPSIAVECVKGLLTFHGKGSSDQLAKSKIIEKLTSVEDVGARASIVDALGDLLQKSSTTDVDDPASRRKRLIDLLVVCFTQMASSTADREAGDLYARVLTNILLILLRYAYFELEQNQARLSPAARQYARIRILTCLEHGLKNGKGGRRLLHDAVRTLRALEKNKREYRSVVELDDQISTIVQKAWRRLQKLFKPASWGVANESMPEDGLVMLYCLTMLQVYNGDEEAVGILEDLNGFYDEMENGDSLEAETQADALVEVLLSFEAKPSKFFRRISLQVFGCIAPEVTLEGIQSLIRVLQAEESVHGQQELFDAHDGDEEQIDQSESGGKSDVEMIDSDVAEVNGVDSSASESESDSSSNAEDDEGKDELAVFNAKLAAALGTRKGEEDVEANDTEGSANADMDDSDMKALDEKLEEVFRGRKAGASKKQEKKEAKKTMVNFKNRVLDLIDIYLKQVYTSQLSLELILPLLQLARKTKVKQLADRACGILREFCSRCRGRTVPAMMDKDGFPGRNTLDLLRAIHEEAGRGGTNAHASVCSAASILVVKVLVEARDVPIEAVVDVYGETRKAQLKDKASQIAPSFFTDWNNWCATASQKPEQFVPMLA